MTRIRKMWAIIPGFITRLSYYLKMLGFALIILIAVLSIVSGMEPYKQYFPAHFSNVNKMQK